MLEIPKPGGGWRVVVNYRELKKQTVTESYLLPKIEEILSKLRGAKIFLKTD